MDNTNATAADEKLIEELLRVFGQSPDDGETTDRAARVGRAFVNMLHAMGYVWALPRYAEIPRFIRYSYDEFDHARRLWNGDLTEMFEGGRELLDVDLYGPEYSMRYIPHTKFTRQCELYHVPVDMNRTEWAARVVRDLIRSRDRLPDESRLARFVAEAAKWRNPVKIGRRTYTDADSACVAWEIEWHPLDE